MVKSRSTDVDVVIPVHGEFELLRKCVAALPAAMGGYAYRIILVDDLSPQPLSEVWEEITAGQDARLLINDERKGFAHTCNRGSKFGFSPYVLFLNSDCVLTEKSGAILMDTLKEAPDIGIASPLLLFPEDQSVSYRPAGKVQHAGMAFDLHGTPLHIFVGWSPDNPKVKHHREVQAVTGACMAVKRETINKVGELIRRFDKKFQQGMFFQEDYGMGCLVGDTLLFTEDGLSTLKDLMPDLEKDSPVSINIASTEDAREATIAHINGSHPTLKLTTERGFEITGTPNHKIVTMGKTGVPEWKALDELRNGDFVAIRKGANVWGKGKIDKDEAYLLGQFVAEGCFTDKQVPAHQDRITITTGDDETGNFLVERGFSKNGIHYRKGTSNFMNRMYDYGLRREWLSDTKEVPQSILSADREGVKNFLSGLFDGDGTAKKSNGWVSLTTTSLKLAKQVQMLLLNFGIVSSVTSRNVGGKPSKILSGKDSIQKEAYDVSLTADSDIFYREIGFRLGGKQARGELLVTTAKQGGDVPSQGEMMRALYNKPGRYERNYEDLYGSVRVKNPTRQTIKNLLMARENFSDTPEFKHLFSMMDNNVYWAKVMSVEDAGVQETFDLHVPVTNAYVANGLIVHNTFEDIDACFCTRSVGYRVVFNPDAVGYHYTGASAVSSKTQFPLQRNDMIFRARFGHLIKWDEYVFV